MTTSYDAVLFDLDCMLPGAPVVCSQPGELPRAA